MSRSFLRELKRRHVVRVGIAYAIVGWLLIQFATQVFPVFSLPNWTAQLVVLLAVLGFPVALVLAWAYEMTPDGVRRTEPAQSAEARSPEQHHRVGRALDFAIIGVLAVALVFVLLRQFAARDAPAPAAKGSTLAAAAKSVAVLPFDNLSDDKSNAYFAEGIQDEILTRLASIAELKVISRTSTKRYEAHPENLREIAGQLGVVNILEGSVQKAGDAVRVNVQLIDALSDAHLWAQTYDRDLKNVFAVESEISQQIADVLKARLTPQETTALVKAPTQNAAAYDAFLQAEYLAHKAIDSQEESDYLAAGEAYRRTLALDADFALAHARLAYMALNQHWNVRPFSAAQLADVKKSVDRALALAPELPEAHLAAGYYSYWGFRRYDEAVAEFQRALKLAPSDAQAFGAVGFIHRRKGEWEEALAALKQSLVFSPRDANIIDELGLSYVILRRYDDGEQALTRALAIDPEDSQARDWLFFSRLFGRGDIAGARATFKPPPGWRIAESVQVGGDVLWLINPRVYADFYERKFDAALQAWDSAPVDKAQDRLSQRTARVVIQMIAGRGQQAQTECRELAPLLDAALAQSPDVLSLLQQRSWVALCLGNKVDAIAAARRATQILPLAKDAYYGAFQIAGLAQIDAHAGAADEAVPLIEQLLTVPAGATMTIPRLKSDPVWDPLRGNPRFDALLRRYETAQAQR